MGLIPGETVAGQVINRPVSVAGNGLLYGFADLGRIYSRPDYLQGCIQCRPGGLYQLIMAAEVNGHCRIGDVAIHMHPYVQLDHILFKGAGISRSRSIVSRNSVQGDIAGKGGLASSAFDGLFYKLGHLQQRCSRLHPGPGLGHDLG